METVNDSLNEKVKYIRIRRDLRPKNMLIVSGYQNNPVRFTLESCPLTKRPLSVFHEDLRFDFLSEIHEQKYVILNTNPEFSQWVNDLYDERMTTALIGCLTHHVELILFPGRNNRLRESSINEAWGRINTQEVGNYGENKVFNVHDLYPANYRFNYKAFYAVPEGYVFMPDDIAYFNALELERYKQEVPLTYYEKTLLRKWVISGHSPREKPPSRYLCLTDSEPP